ncbi:hypothetical protein N2601_08985 [Rhizobium sp. CB3060]|uniref:hypothetical protein n=1 Tax=Rhizobium sp. CB3060 TaxID=3138255 RepID=UPI0021A38A59|nr:hypothetical protein [Rhizobium tropici]UWU23059.1 hypothetical protein N2601_08985 [Rhizobium tropici]
MVSLKDIFERPFAGPETKVAYEAALGKFLVTFNSVENYMRWIVELALKEHGREDLWKMISEDMFDRQIKNLRLVSVSVPNVSEIPFDRLAALNKLRNKFAHGHYDQDLFSDEFRLVGKKEVGIKTTLEEVRAATNEADDLWQELTSVISHLLPPEEDDLK